MSKCRLHNIVCAYHIVRNRFNNIDLHERNMFVRSRMENNLWLVLLEDLRKTFLVANISNDRVKCEFGIIVFEFKQDLKNAVLTMTK